LLLRNLIDRDHAGARFKLTPLGRDVLGALLKPPIDESWRRILSVSRAL
jgi:hypothetical protein